ncbi:BpuSI family type II restriction endonuclease [Verrucomicrobiota bacterium]
MCWLTYSNDEVRCFHPVFQEAADRALTNMDMTDEYVWTHHQRTPGNRLIPDFVLSRRDSGRWFLSMEIKRNISSVYSTRNQIQSQGYATTNLDQYERGRPQYYAISNLEHSLLFALRPGLSPNECRVSNGAFVTGLLNNLTEDEFRDALTLRIEELTRRVTTDRDPSFDDVWPHIITTFIQTAASVNGTPVIEEPVSNGWPLVRDYFCHTLEVDTSRVLVLRCLLAEYIHGILERYGHPEIGTLLPLVRSDPTRVGQTIATTLSRLRHIDFHALFEESCFDVYRTLHNQEHRENLSSYVNSIVSRPAAVRELARDRLDRSEFLDGVIDASYRGERLDDKGKVLTDPELASLLCAAAMISGDSLKVIDPCCGDGALLEAAYDRFKTLGLSHAEAIEKLQGVEADPILMRMAFLRLTIKEPSTICQDSEANILRGDMFASADKLASADVVLMNPPFRRYEAQDANPVPEELRAHYATSIERLSGAQAIGSTGQQNLFTFYVEYILAAVSEGCRLALILDNKWYHNRYAAPLRKLLLDSSHIEAIIEYPYANLFSGNAIATSILICTKSSNVAPDRIVRFVRCQLDLTQVNPEEVVRLIAGEENVPVGWTCKEMQQGNLDHRLGWKNAFSDELLLDYRTGLPALPSMFQYARRGSLAKEEGGMSALAFPFSSQSFGYLREENTEATRRYQNIRLRPLTADENRELGNLASIVDDQFHGYAINNSDILNDYILTEAQVLQQPTLEPPAIRSLPDFWSQRKTGWLQAHSDALAEISANAPAQAFIEGFRRITGLERTFMPDEWLFVGMKEPYAGELVIPRKMRAAHRVYLNPFACTQGRQVRLSSNFVSYAECTSIDPNSNLDRLTATRLIAAFLVSSFGQLQFEMKGYNREGCLSLELHHLEEVCVLDPRNIPEEHRERILETFAALPYPIPADRLSHELPERNVLDEAIAASICLGHDNWSERELLVQVHTLLDEYLVARSR